MSEKKNCSGKNCLLTVSVVANVLLFGVLVGGIVHMPMPQPPQEISEKAQDTFKKVLAEKKSEIKGVVKDIKQQKEALYEVMVAENFDGAAYDAAAKSFSEVTCHASEHKLQTFKEILPALSVEDRRKIARHFIDNVLLNKSKKHGGGHKAKIMLDKSVE